MCFSQLCEGWVNFLPQRLVSFLWTFVYTYILNPIIRCIARRVVYTVGLPNLTSAPWPLGVSIALLGPRTGRLSRQTPDRIRNVGPGLTSSYSGDDVRLTGLLLSSSQVFTVKYNLMIRGMTSLKRWWWWCHHLSLSISSRVHTFILQYVPSNRFTVHIYLKRLN